LQLSEIELDPVLAEEKEQLAKRLSESRVKSVAVEAINVYVKCMHIL
jgi:hypothetical protein